MTTLGIILIVIGVLLIIVGIIFTPADRVENTGFGFIFIPAKKFLNFVLKPGGMVVFLLLGIVSIIVGVLFVI